MFIYTSNIDKSQQKKYLNYSSAYTTTNPTSILGYCKNSVLGAQNTNFLQDFAAPDMIRRRNNTLFLHSVNQ